MTNFLWYLLPLFFGMVGYQMVANSLAYDNKDAVRKSFKLGIFSSCVWGSLVILWIFVLGGSD